MHYNFACLSSKLCCCFFNIWVQETMWTKTEGNPASELPWEQSSWSLKTRSAAATVSALCVCVCGQWHALFCVLVWILLLLFSSFCKKCVFVSACLCEVSQAGFSPQKFPTAVSLFIFFQLQLDRFTWESISLKVVSTWPQCNHFFSFYAIII